MKGLIEMIEHHEVTAAALTKVTVGALGVTVFLGFTKEEWSILLGIGTFIVGVIVAAAKIYVEFKIYQLKKLQIERNNHVSDSISS